MRTVIEAEKVNEAQCKNCGRTYDVSHVETFALATCPGCGTKNTAPGKVDDLMLVEVIGAGGMGVVYRAVDLMLHREVAVKVMKPVPGGRFASGVTACLQEARAQARISHPNVVQVHSISWHGDQPFIVMEMVTGGNAHKLITKDPPMDEARAIRIAIDVAKGLDAAWRAKLVFGDVKPANILLDQWGTAKLADFGLSRMARGTIGSNGEPMGSSISGGSSLLEVSEPTGTASYVAPEVAKRKMPDFRSDIYSLGVTMYHMLVGETPFQGTTKKEKIAARMNGVVPQVGSARRTVHPRVNAVVAKMMAFYPEDRHQSYSDLVAELERALAGLQGDLLVSALGDTNNPQGIAELDARGVQVAGASGEKRKSLATRLFQGAAGVINRAIGAEKPRETDTEPKTGTLRRYDPDPHKKPKPKVKR